MPALAPVTTATRLSAVDVVIRPTLVGVLNSPCVPDQSDRSHRSALLLLSRFSPRLTDPGLLSVPLSRQVWPGPTSRLRQRTDLCVLPPPPSVSPPPFPSPTPSGRCPPQAGGTPRRART